MVQSSKNTHYSHKVMALPSVFVINCICTICKYTRGLLLYEPPTKVNI